MAKTKIYFWLKIDKKFFDNIFIKRLKTVPGGYTMTVIYIRLMLESLESDCILYYEGYFDNLKEELALKLDVSEDDIDMTMAYFTKIKTQNYRRQKPWYSRKPTKQHTCENIGNSNENKRKILQCHLTILHC